MTVVLPYHFMHLNSTYLTIIVAVSSATAACLSVRPSVCHTLVLSQN